mgnify:CR=1 FL=1
MEFQSSEDSVPSAFITEELSRQLIGRPPATGAWRDGDPAGDRQFASIKNLQFENGRQLDSVRIAFESWGEPNSDKSNAVLVLHALTGDSHAAGPASKAHPTEGWWNGIIGPGLAIDTDKWWVLAPNMLGGCQGSSGPSSLASNGVEYGSNFPFVTIRDQVNAQKQFAEIIGVTRWAAVIGGSMGGMQALSWAALYPERVRSAVIIASTARHSAQNIAFHEVGRQAIMADPSWNNGAYYGREAPSAGLAVARMAAHITYLSEEGLTEKFGRRLQNRDAKSFGFDADFQVESYLRHQGLSFVDRFDANSYLYITRAMDYFDLAEAHDGVLAKTFAVQISLW